MNQPPEMKCGVERREMKVFSLYLSRGNIKGEKLEYGN